MSLDSDDDHVRPPVRAVKDPNAPQRPKSSYMLFCAHNRARVIAANPGLQLSEFNRILGEEWFYLSATARQPYERMSAEAREKYEREKAQYTGNPGRRLL
eukprot:gnl/Spiro4/27618_TR13747_c0_g1_i2.p2 gnl/Spiro4/27618_TR13747_c0_g1~~gnl/Spiro4/27618_TR13747_c0_g1_i2.p2  ORF type:complete len:100 (-),score=10.92 gnl/Spiro4/27618_TR13747_c0_g1_i2:181-480(-)